MNSSDNPKVYPLVAEGGAAYKVDPSRDPFEALDDLMTVLEALCPVWPPREITKDGDSWLL
jgi:hypothetical protein